MAKKRYGISIKYHNGSTRKVWYEKSEQQEAAYTRYKGRTKTVGRGREVFYVKKIQRS